MGSFVVAASYGAFLSRANYMSVAIVLRIAKSWRRKDESPKSFPVIRSRASFYLVDQRSRSQGHCAAVPKYRPSLRSVTRVVNNYKIRYELKRKQNKRQTSEGTKRLRNSY